MPLFRIFFLASVAGAIFLTPASALAQNLGRAAQPVDISATQILLVFLFLGLLVAAAFLIVKFRGGSSLFLTSIGNRRIHVRETARVAPQTMLSIIWVDKVEYVIITTPNAATVVEKRTLEADEHSPLEA